MKTFYQKWQPWFTDILFPRLTVRGQLADKPTQQHHTKSKSDGTKV